MINLIDIKYYYRDFIRTALYGYFCIVGHTMNVIIVKGWEFSTLPIPSKLADVLFCLKVKRNVKKFISVYIGFGWDQFCLFLFIFFQKLKESRSSRQLTSSWNDISPFCVIANNDFYKCQTIYKRDDNYPIVF